MSRERFYLRDGSAVPEAVWRTKHTVADYLRVAETTLPSGLWVSTVWTGVDDEPTDPEPGIFATAVFDRSQPGLPRAVDEARHATEAAAVAGHAAMVARWRDRPAPR